VLIAAAVAALALVIGGVALASGGGGDGSDTTFVSDDEPTSQTTDDDDSERGGPLTADQAKQALATVITAENAYYEENGEYTEEEREGGAADALALDVGDVETDWGTGVIIEGEIAFWIGLPPDEDAPNSIEDALYLGVRTADDKCLYVRAISPDNIVTAEDTVRAEDGYCPNSDEVDYGTSEWELP
jgi:hypothetical protein